jgi:hypothetical protein
VHGHNFYPPSGTMPLDQADGLRRLFAGRRQVLLPLVANPHVAFSGVVLDRLASVLAAMKRKVLVVDAAAMSPQPPELAALDLGACIEPIAPRVGYLPARGLPLAHVDTRGTAWGFVDALTRAAPQADLLLLHADATDLARIFRHRAARPVLLGADHPESIKHAYAGAKLLAQRCNLLSFDLLLAAPPHSPRAEAIANSVAGCAEGFLGACLCHWALVDPAADPAEPADASLHTLLQTQLALDASAPAPGAYAPSAHRAAFATAAPAVARTAFR